jgi:hypothetical protein
MLDLYIHIKSGDKSILIKLDDCPLIAGQRRIGDGFRLMKETP